MKAQHQLLSPKSSQSGFTLIEVMIVVFIITVLAAIAIPSYKHYILKNAESQAQVRMKQIQTELETWRASRLTYKGFMPKKIGSDGKTTYSYDDGVNGKTIDVAKPATGGTARYTIELTNGEGNSLNAASNTTLVTSANSWQMIAKPETSLADYGASTIILNSGGTSCKASKGVTLTANMTTCPTGASSW